MQPNIKPVKYNQNRAFSKFTDEENMKITPNDQCEMMDMLQVAIQTIDDHTGYLMERGYYQHLNVWENYNPPQPKVINDSHKLTIHKPDNNSNN